MGNLVVIASGLSAGSNGPFPSGGGVSTWYAAPAVTGNTQGDPFYPNLGGQYRFSLWWGIVDTPGSNPLTVLGNGYCSYVFREFEAGAGVTYSQDQIAGSWGWHNNPVAGSGTVVMGPVTPGGSGPELYVGVLFTLIGTWTAPAGFSYDTEPTYQTTLVWGLDVDSAGAPYSPTSTGGTTPNCDFECCFEATVVAPNDIVMML